jgi:hypothetical protein
MKSRALFSPADRIAPMAAGVEQDLDAAFLVPDDDDAVLTDVVEEEVARVRDLAVVAHEVPCPGEDALQLHLVDGLVGEHLPVHGALVVVDHRQEIGRPQHFRRHCRLLSV